MKKKATLHPFLKMAKVKSEKEFYEKYPTDEHFFDAHPQARYGILMRADDGEFMPTNHWSQEQVPEEVMSSRDSYMQQLQNGNQPIAQQPLQGMVKKPQGAGNYGNASFTPEGFDPRTGRPLKYRYNGPQQNPLNAENEDEQNQDNQDTENQNQNAQASVPGGDNGSKKNRKSIFPKINFGNKSWNPFKKDNAWNTGNGVDTANIMATGTGILAGALPFQPVKQNEQILQPAITQGNYGYGSQASFEDGGNISSVKAREMLHNPPHGKDLTEKQRKYFGAIASGYAADGGPMITNVSPSPHTYFRPMTKTSRQKMDMPDYMPDQSNSDLPFAENGWSSGIPGVGGYQAPVSPQERAAYNKYRGSMYNQPGRFVRNWDHNQDYQKQMAQKVGFDYNRLGAIQQDMQQLARTQPGRIQRGKEMSPADNWMGSKTMQQGYTTYGYAHNRADGSRYYEEHGTEPLTQQEMRGETPQGFVGRSRTAQTQEMGQPLPNENLSQFTSSLPGTYAKQTQGTSDGSNPNDGTSQFSAANGMMLNAYPHKMGRMYRPYDHTYTMAQGGIIPVGEEGLQVEGNQFRYLSPQTIELVGPKHENGGIDIAYNGNRVEAEGGETFHVDNNGMWSGGNMAEAGTSVNAGIVGGNLYTSPDLLDMAGVNKGKMKYKDFFADVIAPRERKALKMKDKVTGLSDKIGKNNKYEGPLNGTIKVKSDGISQYEAFTNNIKDFATNEQNKQLEIAEQFGIEPKVLNKHLNYAKWGKTMANGGSASRKLTAEEKSKLDSYKKSNPSLFDSLYDQGRKNFKGKGNLEMWGPGYENVMQNWKDDNSSNNGAVNNNTSTNQRFSFEPLPQQQPFYNKYVNGHMGYMPELGPVPASTGIDEALKAPNLMEVPKNPKLNLNTSKFDKKKGKGLREKHYLDPSALRDAFEQADPYQSMQIQPYLESDYNISLQQKKNAIQSAFAPAIKAAKTPAQQAAITAQMAEQLGAVDSEEFNINQQNRAGILARNLGEMRGVRDTNLKLAMDAYEKGLGAKEAARQIRRHGAEKLFSDWRATDALNKQLAIEEQYAGWAYDPKTKEAWEKQHPDEVFNPRTVSIADFYEEPAKKNKKNWVYDSKTGKKIQEISEELNSDPTTYFGGYIPGIQRVYFAGGAMGSGMQGMQGQSGLMASRYSPGGDTSYYQKKKKKKKVS